MWILLNSGARFSVKGHSTGEAKPLDLGGIWFRVSKQQPLGPQWCPYLRTNREVVDLVLIYNYITIYIYYINPKDIHTYIHRPIGSPPWVSPLLIKQPYYSYTDTPNHWSSGPRNMPTPGVSFGGGAILRTTQWSASQWKPTGSPRGSSWPLKWRAKSCQIK